MPRSKRTDAAARISWVWTMNFLAMVSALPQAVRADGLLPASVRACRAELDSLKRLICFDKEVARYDVPPSGGDATRKSDTNPSASTPAVSPRASPPDATPTTKDVQSSSTQDRDAVGDAYKAPAQSKHIKARVVSIDDRRDDVVVRLDNGQVWEQEQPAPADLNLQRGETVTIDKELGSYWLAGRSGTAMKVMRKE